MAGPKEQKFVRIPLRSRSFFFGFDECVERLRAVFQVNTTAGRKLNTTKCKLAGGENNFLGHAIGNEGVPPNPETTRAIAAFDRLWIRLL